MAEIGQSNSTGDAAISIPDDGLDWDRLLDAPAKPADQPYGDKLWKGEQEPIDTKEIISHDIAAHKVPELNPYGLTQQELLFAQAYAVWGNLGDACRFAGYRGDHSTGRNILDRPHVAGAVRWLREKAAQQTLQPIDIAVNGNEVMGELWKIAQANIIDAFNQDPETGALTIKRLCDIPRSLHSAIKSIKISAKGDITLELHDKLAALRMVAYQVSNRRIPRPGSPEDDEPIDDAAETNPTPPDVTGRKTLTYEEVVKANGDKIRRRIISAKSA